MEFDSSDTKEPLKWKVRFDIALGIAEGLLYLHEGCHRRIIHRDIKASNILLTEDYQPQVLCLYYLSCYTNHALTMNASDVNSYHLVPSMHRYQILGLQSGFLTN